MGGGAMKEMDKSEVITMIEQGNYARAILRMVSEVQVRHPKDVVKLLSGYAKRSQEHFLVLTLDGAHKPIRIHTVTKGLVNRTVIHPREVFRVAIKDNAVAIIVAHNHPSGNMEPSKEDIDITERLLSAGEIVGIPILDHMIIGKYGSYSFIEHGHFRSQTVA
ncbi:DNA repair protein RadC (modular protein) [uncultured Spirochaetota bacterium]|nr:DNA repair protein RadC (modular protein) [uncultured Spirochaetota bacterium]